SAVIVGAYMVAELIAYISAELKTYAAKKCILSSACEVAAQIQIGKNIGIELMIPVLLLNQMFRKKLPLQPTALLLVGTTVHKRIVWAAKCRIDEKGFQGGMLPGRG